MKNSIKILLGVVAIISTTEDNLGFLERIGIIQNENSMETLIFISKILTPFIIGILVYACLNMNGRIKQLEKGLSDAVQISRYFMATQKSINDQLAGMGYIKYAPKSDREKMLEQEYFKNIGEYESDEAEQ